MGALRPVTVSSLNPQQKLQEHNMRWPNVDQPKLPTGNPNYPELRFDLNSLEALLPGFGDLSDQGHTIETTDHGDTQLTLFVKDGDEIADELKVTLPGAPSADSARALMDASERPSISASYQHFTGDINGEVLASDEIPLGVTVDDNGIVTFGLPAKEETVSTLPIGESEGLDPARLQQAAGSLNIQRPEAPQPSAITDMLESMVQPEN